MRIDHRIFVIESGDVTDRNDVVLQPIDPAAAVSPCVRRKSERMHDLAFGKIALGDFPKLFDAERENLRLLAFHQAEARHQLLREGAARAFAEHGDLCEQIDSGLKIRLLVAFLIDAFVARANADHGIILIVKYLGRRKFRENIDPRGLAFFT